MRQGSMQQLGACVNDLRKFTKEDFGSQAGPAHADVATHAPFAELITATSKALNIPLTDTRQGLYLLAGMPQDSMLGASSTINSTVLPLLRDQILEVGALGCDHSLGSGGFHGSFQVLGGHGC